MKKHILIVIGIILLVIVIWTTTVAGMEYSREKEEKESKNYKNATFEPFLTTIYCKNYQIML